MRSFEQRLLNAWPPSAWSDLTLLLAVSGGADSVALLRAMHVLAPQARARLIVAHFNHGWRGAESDAEERFVSELSNSLGLPVVVGRPSPGAQPDTGDGLEAQARDQRYAFFRQLADSRGARCVVTAHTADDQAETILYHILRGTGLSGLSGMPRHRQLSTAATLIRPMLEIERGEVLRYLEELGQDFCVDTSNESREFTRNRVRHELLPLLERDYSAGVRKSLLRLGQIAADAQRVIAQAAEELLDAATLVRREGSLVLDAVRLEGRDRHLVREVFVAAWRRQGWPQQAMTFAHWNLLADAVLAPRPRTDSSLKFVLPGTITAESGNGRLTLAAQGSTKDSGKLLAGRPTAGPAS